MKKTIYVIVPMLVVVFAGCASWPQFYWPEHKKSKEIQATNELNANCALMSVQYCDHLQANGYDAQIKCDSLPGLINRHCWVEVKNPDDNKWYMIDLALDTGGFEVKYYSKNNKRNLDTFPLGKRESARVYSSR